MKKTVEKTIKDNAELIAVIDPVSLERVGDECIVIRLFKGTCENFDEVKKELGLNK